MNIKKRHGLGMILILLGGAIFFIKSGTSILHYNTLIFLMIFIGMYLSSTSFYDALVSGGEE